MEMPGRSYNSPKYRYGYNGKEKDPEGLGGGGSTYDYGFRIYNPGIARFSSVDPLSKKYPMLTPYQFSSNRPIDGIDLDGLEYYKMQLAWDAKQGKPLVRHLGERGVAKGVVTYEVHYKNDVYIFTSTNYAKNIPRVKEEFGLTDAQVDEYLAQNLADPANTVANFDDWLQEAKSMDEFEAKFQSRNEFYTEVELLILEEYATGLAGSSGVNAYLKGKKAGTIYKVPGSSTTSGKPYIGRHNKSTPQTTRKANDGRDRSKAEVVDTYDPANIEEGRYKEQKAIDQNGGVGNLDNKRNEVNPNQQNEYKQKYGDY